MTLPDGLTGARVGGWGVERGAAGRPMIISADLIRNVVPGILRGIFDPLLIFDGAALSWDEAYPLTECYTEPDVWRHLDLVFERRRLSDQRLLD